MDRIKKIKIKKSDGTSTDYLPLGSDAEYIDLENGNNLQEEINHITKSYNNVAAMKADETLKVGDICQTLGYYEVNDGGRAEYKIVNGTYTDDGGSYHKLENNLFAELVIKDSINVKQFGAYGDGIHDDTQAIQKTLTFGRTNNYTIISSENNNYLISTRLYVATENIDFHYASIFTNTEGLNLIVVSTDDYYGSIKNITLDCNGKANSAIYLDKARKKTLENINILNVNNKGIHYQSGYEVFANKIHITGTSTSTSSIGLYLKGGDSHWTDIICIDCHTAIDHPGGLNYLTRIHAWILNYQVLENSKFLYCNNNQSTIYLTDCYDDTYHYGFYIDGDIAPRLFIKGLSCLYNETIYSYAHLPQQPIVFYFTQTNQNNGSHNIKITHSWIQGNWAAGLTKTIFSNVIIWNGAEVGNVYSNIFRPTVETTVRNIDNTIFTPIRNKVIKKNSTVSIDLTLRYDASKVNGKTVLGDLYYFFRPSPEMYINTAGYISDTDNNWIGEPTNVYLDNSTFFAYLPNGTGTKFLHFTCCFNLIDE